MSKPKPKAKATRLKKGHIRLLPFPVERWSRGGSPITIQAILTSPPFGRTRQGEYVHRIRDAARFQGSWRPGHCSYRTFCGLSVAVEDEPGRNGRNGELFVEPPKGAPLCAVCEGKATGAGLTGRPRTIGGRLVMYRPRL